MIHDNITPQELVEMLDGKRNLRVERLGKIGGNQMMMYFMLDGQQVVIQVGVTHISSIETVKHGGGASIHVNFDSQTSWSVAELQKQGLPLYWNEAWLREQLQLLTTFEAIAQAYGWAGNSISHFAREKFGIELKSRIDRAKKERIVRAHLEQNIPMKKLAAEHGVAIGSISGWVAKWKKGMPLD